MGRECVVHVALGGDAGEMLDAIHVSLLDRARAFQTQNTHDPQDYDAFREVVKAGWAFSWWCGERECEAAIKEDTRATTRNIPLDQPDGRGTCIRCGKPSVERAIFSRAY